MERNLTVFPLHVQTGIMSYYSSAGLVVREDRNHLP